jgi:hypothetical protein
MLHPTSGISDPNDPDPSIAFTAVLTSAIAWYRAASLMTPWVWLTGATPLPMLEEFTIASSTKPFAAAHASVMESPFARYDASADEYVQPAP